MYHWVTGLARWPHKRLFIPRHTYFTFCSTLLQLNKYGRKQIYGETCGNKTKREKVNKKNSWGKKRTDVRSWKFACCRHSIYGKSGAGPPKTERVSPGVIYLLCHHLRYRRKLDPSCFRLSTITPRELTPFCINYTATNTSWLVPRCVN